MSVSVIREDMMGFEGYLENEVVQDLDKPGPLSVIGRRSAREAAGEPVSEQRSRVVGRRLMG